MTTQLKAVLLMLTIAATVITIASIFIGDSNEHSNYDYRATRNYFQ